MHDIRVNHGVLDTASQDLTAAANRIQAIVDRLESDLDRHQHGWSGDAKEAYLPARRQWQGAIADMRVLLTDLGVAVDTSNRRFLEADLRGGALFG